MDVRKLEDLAEHIRNLLPSGASELRDEVKMNLRAALGAALARMDLVTREEFDAQSALLARTRERLEKLEATVQELERRASA
jgi:hypothetical protein